MIAKKEGKNTVCFGCDPSGRFKRTDAGGVLAVCTKAKVEYESSFAKSVFHGGFVFKRGRVVSGKCV